MDLLLLVCLCLLTWSGTTFGKRVIATEGSDVILPCFLNESLVPMMIIWEKEESPMKKLVFKYNNRRHSNDGLTDQDEEFKGRVIHFSDKLRDGDASIRISNTKITDSGNYRCNIPGRKLFHIELVVGKSEVNVAEDSDVILSCSLNNENLEQKEFVWKKDDQKVVFHYNNGQHSNNQLIDQDNDFNKRVFHFQSELKNGNASIKITNIKKTDSGRYTCTIQGKQESFITLGVGAAQKPYVTILDETNDWSLLQCEVQGASPQPDVQWQDSDGNTLTAEEPQVTTDGERYNVIINVKVTRTDKYRCVVTQKEIDHQINSTIYVHINGAATVSYIGIVNTTENGVLLQCDVLGASPKPKVEWQDGDGNVICAEEPEVTSTGGRYNVTLFCTVNKTTTNRFKCVVKQEETGHTSQREVHVPDSVLDMNTSDPRPQETEQTTEAVTPERNQFISPPQGADVKTNESDPKLLGIEV